MEKRLNIFKASAGSGKTFRLTVEYIKLLIADPTAYKHILAVTFTNKATAEMKERILNTLSGLANHDPSASGYLENIKKAPEISQFEDKDIAYRARLSLTNILHDYSRFRIETIDSFFQSIIRNLAHELSLTANLRVDLDQEQVLSDAVRKIIEELQVDGSALYLAIKAFIEENIETGSNWQINDRVKTFSKNIFKEVYLNNEDTLSKAVADPKFFDDYKELLKQHKDQKIQNIKDWGSRFFDLCDKYGCNDSSLFFQKTKGPFSYMDKLREGIIIPPTSSVTKCLEGEAALSKDPSVVNHESEFLETIAEAVKAIDADTPFINSVGLVLRHINEMRLLNAVDQKVRKLNQQANRFLLADTAHFLNEMICDSDIPFIYEKAGTTFHHIMIDEFQDTSSLQWQNFRPLLRNSLDAGHTCLIVGDVKQSIYRWRNAEWEILNSLEVSSDFKDDINLEPLDTNYRSAEHIITFNNKLFSAILEDIESDDVKQAYADVTQHFSSRNANSGYVHIDSLPNEEYKENTLRCITDTIDRLLAEGVQQSDIALLLRTNNQISEISTFLAKERPDIKIVSDEAYRLDSSKAINIIILALKVVANPADRLSVITLLLMIGIENPFLMTDEEIAAHMPRGFYNQLEELALLPLLELCHTLYNIFSLVNIPGQDAYLMSFYDRINEYVTDENIDLPSFLSWWDDKLSGVNIPADSIDGIRAMTVHKSKGLEFHTVICPYCDWSTKVDYKGLIWCKPTEVPFSQLPLTAISCTKEAANSIFHEDFALEETKCLVDSLNILYVALTRASHNLFIITGKYRNESIYEMLTSAIEKLLYQNDTIVPCQSPYIDSEAYEYGTLEKSPCASPKPIGTESPSLDPSRLTLHFISTPSHAEFRQSNKSMQFVGTIDDEDSDDRLRYINEGLAVHRFLELMQSGKDKEKIIERLDKEGYFENKLYRKSILALIHQALSNNAAMDWFSDRWQVFNECTIITSTPNCDATALYRPDRVITDGHETIVIDYKTGRQSPLHQQQVRTYMSLLSQMGYPSVRGILWYIRHDEIVEVTALSV